MLIRATLLVLETFQCGRVGSLLTSKQKPLMLHTVPIYSDGTIFMPTDL